MIATVEPAGQRPAAGSAGRLWLGAVVMVLLTMWSSSGTAAAAEPTGLLFVRPQPSGPAGSAIQVVGVGFDPNTTVEIRWNDAEGTQIGAALGPDFTVDVAVPTDAAGLNSLVAFSRDVDGAMGTAASIGFLVTGSTGVAPTSGAESGSAAAGDAAGTGAPEEAPVRATSAAVWVGLGAALAVIGGVSVAARRRARHSSPPAPPSPATPPTLPVPPAGTPAPLAPPAGTPAPLAPPAGTPSGSP